MIPKNKLPVLLKNLLRNNEHILSLFQTSQGKIKYAVSNYRVINCMNPKNIRSCYYEQVYNIMIGNGKYVNKIMLITDPNISVPTEPHHFYSVFLIERISNAREAYDLIVEAWGKESPYMKRVKPFQALADEYGLTMDTPSHNGRNMIRMKGKVEGMAVQFQLNSVQNPQQLYIRILCPNPDRNYLLIKRETPGDSVEKLFGKQDLRTWNAEFDKRFLLQSDDKEFFKYILTPFIKRQLLDSWKHLDGSIQFGKAPIELPKKKKKEEKEEVIDILDEKVLAEFFPDEEERKMEKTPLVYLCNDIGKNLYNINTKLTESIKNFKTFILVAKRIKDFHS